MRTILYYVSGHGFGHAVRSAEVIRELTARGFSVAVRTSAPRWIFPEGQNVTVEAVETDPGLEQKDSMTVDLGASLARMGDRMESMASAARAEQKVIERVRPSAVVCDISPLGVEAAALAGIPCAVVANFLWDWIARDLGRKEPEFYRLADRLEETYRKATRILRTRLCGGMEGYPNAVDIPLIARKAPLGRDEARDRLGLAPDRAYALLSLGGHGLARFTGGVSERVRECGLLEPGARGKPGEDYPLMLAACDLVIGKMGYGLCSELIAAKLPLLYSARNDFIEFKVLEAETRKYVSALRLDSDVFYNMELDTHIGLLLKTPHPGAVTPTGGARAAAGEIVNLAAPER